MSDLPHFDADAIYSIGMAKAIKILESGSIEPIEPIPRSHVPLGKGNDFLMMPAISPKGIGVKLVTVFPENPKRNFPLIHGHYLYCDRETGRPLATLDGSALTTLRTPAASAVATNVLARSNVRTLGIFGAGVQARGHVEAMLLVRPEINEIVIRSQSVDSSRRFIDSLNVENRKIRIGQPEDVAVCDVICSCTTSNEPVIPTESIHSGSHLNLVGSYSTARREADSQLLNLVEIFVDHRDAAMKEAGELILANNEGSWSFDQIIGDFSDLVNGRTGRTNDEQITLFKSVGLATWDLLVADSIINK